MGRIGHLHQLFGTDQRYVDGGNHVDMIRALMSKCSQ
jgi:hypothetical protein